MLQNFSFVSICNGLTNNYNHKFGIWVFPKSAQLWPSAGRPPLSRHSSRESREWVICGFGIWIKIILQRIRVHSFTTSPTVLLSTIIISCLRSIIYSFIYYLLYYMLSTSNCYLSISIYLPIPLYYERLKIYLSRDANASLQKISLPPCTRMEREGRGGARWRVMWRWTGRWR